MYTPETYLSSRWEKETLAQRELFLTLEKLPMIYVRFKFSALPEKVKEAFGIYIAILG